MAVEEDAVALKEKGNKAFKEHDWPMAIELYTKAIELNDRDVSFFTNRAQVCLECSDYSTSEANRCTISLLRT